MSSVIGITFGNTLSSIAVASADGKVDVIANPDGDRAIPSALSYIGDDEYHGTQAVAQLVRNAKNTIINFRDYIGKQYDDITEFAASGAKPVKADDGSIAYDIERQDGRRELVTVAEACTRHLRQLKAAADDYLGTSVTRAVVAVPTDFSETQRAALAEIAAAAGLQIVQTINEPSAALLAHLSAADRLLLDRMYVVADFGGIRLDAAVIAVRGGILTILATAHTHGLGGDDLDAALADYVAREFEKKNKVDPRTNTRAVAKLKAEAVVAKKTLSNVTSALFSVESLADGIDFITQINRMRFDLAARTPLSAMTAFVESAVAKAGLEPADIDEVVLAGGCANVVKLVSNVRFVFPEKTIVVAPALDAKAVNPEELSTRGAALQAALVDGFDDEAIAESLQAVVVNTQHLAAPIGIRDATGAFQPILVAETAYPIKRTFEVTNGDAPDVVVELFEGKRTVKETVVEQEPDSEDSDESDVEPETVREIVYVPGELLATVKLVDLKPNAKLQVIVNITQNGVLHVAAREVKQGALAVRGEVKAPQV